MRYIFSALCFVCLSFFGSTSAQQTVQREKLRVVAVPQEIVMTVVMPQPDCPLKYERVTAFKYLNGDLAGLGGESYELRNRGSKPIRAYEIVRFITSLNGAGISTEGYWEGETSEVLMPGQVTPGPGGGREADFVPLTDELRDKLKLRGPMQAIIYFMVVRVEFADGTVYSDEKRFKAFEAFQNALDIKIDRN